MAQFFVGMMNNIFYMTWTDQTVMLNCIFCVKVSSSDIGRLFSANWCSLLCSSLSKTIFDFDETWRYFGRIQSNRKHTWLWLTLLALEGRHNENHFSFVRTNITWTHKNCDRQNEYMIRYSFIFAFWIQISTTVLWYYDGFIDKWHPYTYTHTHTIRI